MVTVIGLDVGHSAVKMVVRGSHPFRTCFHSLACTSFPIPGDTKADQTAEDTVVVNGVSYYVGETAYFQRDRHSNTSDMGLHGDWISTPQYEALIRGALQKAELRGNDMSQLVIVNGLPQSDLVSKKPILDSLLKKIAPNAVIKTVSQPMGAFYCQNLDKFGHPVSDTALDERWALIDVGYYTTDLVLMDQGNRIEKASGSSIGVSRIVSGAADRITLDKDNIFDHDKDNPIRVSHQRLMEAIERDSIVVKVKHLGVLLDVSHYVKQAIDSWYTDFVDAFQTKLQPYIVDLDGIIIAGGGAALLFGPLSSKWPHVKLMDDSRFAVSEGFCRFGLLAAPEYFSHTANEAVAT